jgi:hypothetical protein
VQTRECAPRGCIASDGETEIWRADCVPSEPGWIVEEVEPYVPLGEYLERQKRVTGGVSRFLTRGSSLAPIESLKADVNRDSWADGDLSLANCDVRWLREARGPIDAKFAATVHPVGEFGEFHPLTVDEEWRPPVAGFGGKSFETQSCTHQGLFHENVPPAAKYDPLMWQGDEVRPLAATEGYQVVMEREEVKVKKPRFSAVFPTMRVKKGGTDSMTVRNAPATFLTTESEL